ncbi:acyl-CoA dehydratase activase-related protein [Candidatus Acetothermia bacterium]|nr:acyl-CoA dehydratase activase-related protein [Candidatus Acetothermia bacterium]
MTTTTKFRGFELAEHSYKTAHFTCDLCSNLCKITQVTLQDEESLYHGARCGRFDSLVEKAHTHHPDLFAARNQIIFDPENTGLKIEKEISLPPYSGQVRGRIGIPRTLALWDKFPFFAAYFRVLGYEIILSPMTGQKIIHNSVQAAEPNICLPAKITHGHVEMLLNKEIDHIFLPALIDIDHANTQTRTNYTCPLIQTQPCIIKSQFDFAAHGVNLIETPFHFYHEAKVRKELTELGRSLIKNRATVRHAINTGFNAQQNAYTALQRLGSKAFACIETGSLGIVILGRPYNSCDHGISLEISQKLRKLGVLPIPIDILPWNTIDVDRDYPHMQWHSGKRIIAAAKLIQQMDNLYGLYLSHFNCGPDSFILHYVKEILTGKPFLNLELDEHSADAGVVTRCEAFLDSLTLSKERVNRQGRSSPVSAHSKTELDPSKKLYLPNMLDHHHAIEGALIHFGIDAETLPPPDKESITLGRQYATGGECLPFIITAGDFIKLVTKPDFDPEKSSLFMATSSGPCRFCHYFAAQKLIMRKLGVKVDLVTLESYSGYSMKSLGSSFRRATWDGIVAIDMLQKLLWKTRPYEAERGSTDIVYQRALKEIRAALISNGRAGLISSLPKIITPFKTIKQIEEERPLIGIVGEIYLRVNEFSNSNLARLVEELGGEARVAPMSEWIAYTNYKKVGDTWEKREIKAHLKAQIEKKFLSLDEHAIARLFKEQLSANDLEEPLTAQVIAHSDPYISDAYRGEPVLTVGKAIDYTIKGFDGILNVMPFSCMPGAMVSAVSTLIKCDYHLPWLNLTFDGQEQTNLRTRLEAFLHQAQVHKERRSEVIK